MYLRNAEFLCMMCLNGADAKNPRKIQTRTAFIGDPIGKLNVCLAISFIEREE